MVINDVYILDLDKNHTPLPLQLLTSRLTQVRRTQRDIPKTTEKPISTSFPQNIFKQLVGFLCSTISKNKPYNHPNLVKILLILL